MVGCRDGPARLCKKKSLRCHRSPSTSLGTGVFAPPPSQDNWVWDVFGRRRRRWGGKILSFLYFETKKCVCVQKENKIIGWFVGLAIKSNFALSEKRKCVFLRENNNFKNLPHFGFPFSFTQENVAKSPPPSPRFFE